jgi:hypothetical protein
MRDSIRSKQQNNLPPERRPAGNESGSRGQASQKPQRGPGKGSTGLKDKEAGTSDSQGKTRPSGEGGTR